MNKILNSIKNPYKFVYWIIRKTPALSSRLPDDVFLKIAYRSVFGHKLNLNAPTTFNEKLQWLKLYDRKELYTTLVDKYSVKEYVKNRIGNDFIIPNLGVWENFDDIDFDKLPNRFVLKCTHDSGGVYIVKDKSEFDNNKARRKINSCLKKDFYQLGREWPYKNVPHRIIAEKYIANENEDLRDYKFFCFNGIPRFFKVDFDRFTNHRANYYDCDSNLLLPFGEAMYPPDAEKDIVLPSNLELMKELAKKLSAGTRFLRVDLYEVNGKVYFGELTLYPVSGFGKFTDSNWDKKIGEYLLL